MTTRLALVSLLMFVVVLAPACTNENGDTFASTGTVVFLTLEGGFYGIKGDDGNKYDPINLSAEFQKDGLRIRFEAKELTDRASFHMWGKIIEIIHIEKM